ncbi:MAG: septum formation protein Maf [Elusimicrobia bacterium]|nr:septum formation protein Maf [Elusimicrobiota bacterium]
MQDRYIPHAAVFIAAASALQAIEYLLPNPVPWLKLGLANMLTLIALVTAGARFALVVAAGRALITAFLLGTFMSPMFYLSFCGAVLSCLAMSAMFRPLGKFSLIGVSITGAVTHNLTQLAIVYIFVIRHGGILLLLPLLLMTALVTGSLTGVLSAKIIPNIARSSIKKIYLASKSPRRIDILRGRGLPVLVTGHKAFEDAPETGEDPASYALRQARKKMDSVFQDIPGRGCVIAADTVVDIKGEVLTKPESAEDAERMLRMLSGNVQKVFTAVIIRDLGTGTTCERVAETSLKMRTLTESEIENLKDLNLDKAGGYAIQGMKDSFFEWVKGSYTNVVGFPVEEAAECLKRLW